MQTKALVNNMYLLLTE